MGTITVTAADSRPAGSPDECFYCKRAIGSEHMEDCVAWTRRVKVRAIIEYTIEVPHSWDKARIEFHRNKASWCSDNGIEEIVDLHNKAEADGDCMCAVTRYEYVGEADDEQAGEG